MRRRNVVVREWSRAADVSNGSRLRSLRLCRWMVPRSAHRPRRWLPALALVLAGACRLGAAPGQPDVAPTDGRQSGGGPSEPPVLQRLAVSGGGTMYPEFAPGLHHYALTCDDRATLRVVARADAATTGLTLLRDDPGMHHTAELSLDVRLVVAADDDVAIEVRRGAARTTYVVHCLPADFPRIRILKKSARVSEGLLFVTPRPFMAIVDNNGVPRYHRRGRSALWNFRRHATGPLVDGKRVRYSVSRSDEVELLDERLATIRTVNVVGDLQRADPHDFVITRDRNYLFASYHPTVRDRCEAPVTCPARYVDSVIQEVTPRGAEVFRWNSWDHFNHSNCELSRDYAHLNSLQISGDDIIASFRTCSQVLRIDRSGKTGAVEWQLGGAASARQPGTEYLEVVGDDGADNEFCGQHQATLTGTGRVVLFDNGVGCSGPRKHRPQFTRVVEYDISSGTRASYVREFGLPAGQGFTDSMGGVTVLSNGHWLITWGVRPLHAATDRSAVIAVSEYDPQTGAALFHMQMSSDEYGDVPTYRVYREREAAVSIPLNLP